MFEAIHGSAPRMIEEGLGEFANPASILTALSMLLNHIGYSEESEKLLFAIKKANDVLNMTGDHAGNTAKEFCDEVLKAY